MTIVGDNSRVINKLEASLTDDAKVIIYNRHMFIVHATNFLFLSFFRVFILFAFSELPAVGVY